MIRTIKTIILTCVATIVVAAAGLALYTWSGAYGIGADQPHTRVVTAFVATARDRAVRAHAAGIEVPTDLASEARIRQGAGNYAAMCATCHLSPGAKSSELSRGLYPAPPRLDRMKVDPAVAFWVAKHGIKASGMPAWGRSMGDEYLWNMVAFIGALPDLDADAYRALVAQSGGHSHGDGNDDHDHGDDTDPHEGTGHEHGAADAGTSGAAGPPVDAGAAPAVAVVDAFGAALVAGDLATVKDLLDPAVVVLEGGGAERSRDEYMDHHAGADAAFLKDAHVTRTSRTARASGDLAWVATESTIHTHGARPATLASSETMILARHDGVWRIVHIHWSSQPG
ncbi:MAG: c-type cytochrome [Steroidobacteraceae bacterium]